MSIPTIDSEYLLSFLSGLLNTPSPTGLAEPAIAFVEQALVAYPGIIRQAHTQGCPGCQLAG